MQRIRVRFGFTVRRKEYEFRLVVSTSKTVFSQSNPSYFDHGLVVDEILRMRNVGGISYVHILSSEELFDEIYRVFQTLPEEKIRSRIRIQELAHVDN